MMSAAQKARYSQSKLVPTEDGMIDKLIDFSQPEFYRSPFLG